MFKMVPLSPSQNAFKNLKFKESVQFILLYFLLKRSLFNALKAIEIEYIETEACLPDGENMTEISAEQ